MQQILRIILTGLLCAVLLLPATPLSRPESAEASFMSFGVKDELELGKKFNALVRSMMPLVDDPEVEGYVRDHHWYGNNFGGFPIRGDLSDGTRVTLGVRSEHVHLAADGAPARVELVTPYFAEHYQHVDVRAGMDAALGHHAGLGRRQGP